MSAQNRRGFLRDAFVAAPALVAVRPSTPSKMMPGFISAFEALDAYDQALVIEGVWLLRSADQDAPVPADMMTPEQLVAAAKLRRNGGVQ